MTLKTKQFKETIESNLPCQTNLTEIYDQSIKNPEKFWEEAANDIFWFKKPTKILNKSSPPFLQMVRGW